MNVFVELDQTGRAIRIFRNKKAMLSGEEKYFGVLEIPKRMAVGEIRRQIWERTEGNCEWCGAVISEQSLHMHEVIHRGQGGEISLKNSVGICYQCHYDIGHGDRKVRFGETK